MSEPRKPDVTLIAKLEPTARRRLDQAVQDQIDAIGDEQPALLTRREARGEGWAFGVHPSARTMINMAHQGRTIE